MLIHVKVIPKSSRDQVAGWLGDRLKVKVSAPPERGKANAAVEKLLSEVLGATARVVAGATSPLKTVEVDAPEDVVRAKLAR